MKEKEDKLRYNQNLNYPEYFPLDFFGYTSTEGLLDFVYKFQAKYSRLCVDISTVNDFSSFYFNLKQLEDEGYIKIALTPYPEKPNMCHIKDVILTTSGRILRDKIKSTNKWNRIRKRIFELLWVSILSILTTIITMKLSGK